MNKFHSILIVTESLKLQQFSVFSAQKIPGLLMIIEESISPVLHKMDVFFLSIFLIKLSPSQMVVSLPS